MGVFTPNNRETPFGVVLMRSTVVLKDTRIPSANNQLQIMCAAEFEDASSAHIELTLHKGNA